jgi:hypothetical protein
MATGYTRTDTSNNIANGNVINAADLDGEFDAVQAAMDVTTGHNHDGTVGGGAPVSVIGPVQDVVVTTSVLRPKTDNTVDLGTTTLEFKDLFIDGTANIDTLQVDENASVTGTLNVTGTTTLGTVNVTTIDTTNLEVTNLKAKDGTAAGSIANTTGVVTLASSVLTTTDIDGGTIDGVTIATSDITVGAGKTLNVSAGTLTLADNQISGDKVEGGTVNAITITTLGSTTGNITTVNSTTIDTTNLEVTTLKAKDGTSAGSIADSTGVVTLASSVLTTTDINGGTIDGAVIGGASAAAGTFTTATATTGNITTVNATTVDTTNIEVTNIKAKDGTSAGSIEDSTGVVTLASSVLTTTDINGGTIDAAIIGGSTPAAVTGTTVTGTSLVSTGGLTASGASVVSVNSASDALRITQVGAGNALVVEDSTNPDSTPFVVTATGLVGIGTNSPTTALDVQTSGGKFLVDAFGGSSTQIGTANGSGSVFRINGDARLDFYVDEIERMRITSAGNVGIGSAGAVTDTLKVNKNITGGTTAYSIRNDGEIQSDVTTAAYMNRTSPTVVNSAFTLANMFHYSAGQSTIGASATVTNQIGFLSEASLIGATNNSGFQMNGVAVASITSGKTVYAYKSSQSIATGGGTAYNLYMEGTAPSYFAGNVGIGLIPSTSDPLTSVSAGALQVNGNIELRYGGVSTDPAGARYFNIVNTDTTLVTDQPLGGIQWIGLDTTTPNSNMASITSYCASNAGTTSDLRFKIAGSEKIRISAAGNVFQNQPTETSKSAAVTLTIEELLTGIVQFTGSTIGTLTLPTGTNIEAGLPPSTTPNISSLLADMSFDFSVINTGTSAGAVTITTNTGLTLVGSMSVPITTSGLFRVRKTATNTYTIYRIS